MDDPPKPLTVWKTMVCVAILGLMLADLMKSRRDTHLEEASRAAEGERSYRLAEARLREAARSRPGGTAATLRAAANLQRRRAEWNAGKRSRYQRAAQAPWWGVAPDTPWPE